MPGLFISYRRIDSAGFTGRLFDHLSRHFGRHHVFMDIEGGIERGADFPEVIEKTVQSADAMIAVIGRQWLSCVDDTGKRRLDNPDDWVRNEIAAALQRNILLLPVLVDGGSMPAANQLPEDISRLARKQASEISSSRWDYDLAQLIKILERVIPVAGSEKPPAKKNPLWVLPTIIAFTAIALGLGFYWWKTAAMPQPAQEMAKTIVRASDLEGNWRDDRGQLYKIVPRKDGAFDMGRIDPPETDPVYRIVRVNDRSIEISIGVLPSGTQQAVGNLELSVDGNIMSGLLRSTQIDDSPQNWVLRRSSDKVSKAVTPPPAPASAESAAKTSAPAVPQDKLPAGLPTRQSQIVRLAGDVRALAFAPDGKLLAGGGSDNIIHAWITTNRQDWQESRQFGQASQRSAVEAIAFAPEARLLASAHLDGAARIWDLETGRLAQTLNHGGIVYAIAFSRDGRSLFTGGFDKSVRLWNVDSGRQERTIEAGMDIRVLALSPDGRWLAMGGSGKQIKLWDVSGWRLARTLDSPPGNWVVNSLAYSPDGQKLAAAIADGQMKLWDVQGGELRSGRAGSPLTFSAKGVWMAFAHDGKISLQEAVSGREIGVLAGHSEKIDAIAASLDGRWLASGDGSGTIKFWQ